MTLPSTGSDCERRLSTEVSDIAREVPTLPRGIRLSGGEYALLSSASSTMTPQTARRNLRTPLPKIDSLARPQLARPSRRRISAPPCDGRATAAPEREQPVMELKTGLLPERPTMTYRRHHLTGRPARPARTLDWMRSAPNPKLALQPTCSASIKGCPGRFPERAERRPSRDRIGSPGTPAGVMASSLGTNGASGYGDAALYPTTVCNWPVRRDAAGSCFQRALTETPRLRHT